MNITLHRRRAQALRERYPFAAEPLGLYLALLDAWEGVGDDPPIERVVKATEAAGPDPLAAAVRTLDGPAVVSAWLAGADLAPAERYLARAALRPTPVPSLDVGRSTPASRDRPRVDRPTSVQGAACPACGGVPQVSVRVAGGEPLVSGRRELLCSRCWRSWQFSSSACPSCGETTGAKRTVYSEPRGDNATLPHLRIDACASCMRYLIEVDLGRDARAVPEVDELVALPLDLYAAEHGLSKITPNLMGF